MTKKTSMEFTREELGTVKEGLGFWAKNLQAQKDKAIGRGDQELLAAVEKHLKNTRELFWRVCRAIESMEANNG
jgi:hypothetical protein